jgi:hypothetical protein
MKKRPEMRVLAVRMSNDMIVDIQIEALTHECSAAHIVREAVREYMARHANPENPT